MCIHMPLRVYLSNFSQSNTVCISDLLAWWDECVSFWVAETKLALRLKSIVRYIMLKSQFVLYSEVLLALPHHTEFVQTVSKGVDITSTLYSLQYLQMAWTGLEGVSDGYTLNKSIYDSLEIICSFDLELALLLNGFTLILRHATHKNATVCADLIE